jgi:hypothetical protein
MKPSVQLEIARGSKMYFEGGQLFGRPVNAGAGINPMPVIRVTIHWFRRDSVEGVQSLLGSSGLW